MKKPRKLQSITRKYKILEVHIGERLESSDIKTLYIKLENNYYIESRFKVRTRNLDLKYLKRIIIKVLKRSYSDYCKVRSIASI
jgi:hypothetical protein